MSCSGGENPSCSLNESTSPAESDEVLDTQITASDMGIYSSLALPTRNEIRPVNIAVKYWIRSR